MERYVVDRIEGSVAVLGGDDGSKADVDASVLPDGVREGSSLVLDGGAWSVDEADEAERRERIRAKMRAAFKPRG